MKYFVTYLFRCENGILALKFSKRGFHVKVAGQARYQFEEPTATFITSSPKLMDPYERSNLYIGESNIAGILLHLATWYNYIHIISFYSNPILTFSNLHLGMRFADGIFAKRVIPHFRLVAIYAGNRLNQTSYDALFSKSIIFFYLKSYKFFKH